MIRKTIAVAQIFTLAKHIQIYGLSLTFASNVRAIALLFSLLLWLFNLTFFDLIRFNMETSTIEQECYCPICSELKKEARTLSCGHSFCTLCLRSIPISVMIKSSLNCPQCNLPTYVTTGILSLPRALHLEEPIRKLKLQNILKSNQPQPLLYQFQTSQEQSSLPQDQPQSHQENKNSYSYYDQPTQPYHPISIPAPSNTSNAQTVKSPKEKNFFQNFINLDMLKLPAFMSANPTPAPAPAPAPFQPPAPIPTISEEPKPVPPPSNDPIQDSEPLPPAPVVQTEPPVHQMEQAAQPAQEASNNNQQGEAEQGGFFSSIASSIAKSFESVKKTVLMEEDITSSASGVFFSFFLLFLFQLIAMKENATSGLFCAI